MTKVIRIPENNPWSLMVALVLSGLILSTLSAGGHAEVDQLKTIKLIPFDSGAEAEELSNRSEAVGNRNDGELFKPGRFRLANDRKLLGWQFSEALYFGRTKISRKNNVGLVFDLGDTTISVGHKGLFYSFQF